MSFSGVFKALAASSLFLVSGLSSAAEDEEGHPLSTIPLRNIGPALTAGRVSDFAFFPGQWQQHYVAMASGTLWNTENTGVTWNPVFEHEGS